mmetsp:Transcript_4364/g.10794  ORF Transcript_4364/g.10794 Transcript_4364/m.10794 type:complete len:197 (+) Transcript_4364:78-668(+)
MSLSSVSRIRPSNCVFLLCDVQERFRTMIRYFPSVVHVASKLTRASEVLDIPLMVTEQYPKALGHTVAEIKLSEKTANYSKTAFSMFPSIRPTLSSMKDRNVAVLFGIEAHVCVQQTALDLLENGMDVHIVADGTSSSRDFERLIAFERMKKSGAYLTTSESVLFELMGDAQHPSFKAIQALVKEERPDCGLNASL